MKRQQSQQVQSRRWFCWRWPTTATALLLLSAVWTTGAKFLRVRLQADDLVPEIIEACAADGVFFLGTYLLFCGLRLISGGRFVARLTLLIAAVVLAWSILNASWLLATSVQLQPGVLGVLVRSPSQFWPVVETHLAQNTVLAIPIVISAVAGIAWVLWRLVRPARRIGRPVVSTIVALGLLLLASVEQWHWQTAAHTAYSGQVIAFSSHWYALRQVLHDVASPDVTSRTRTIPRAEDRKLLLPTDRPDRTPNVVVILLESVSYRATTLADPNKLSTPFLLKLAKQGVEFTQTRVPIAQTTKAFWATFTGLTPDTNPDAAEAVLVDKPYSSLASILGRLGYRSAFFEMSKGSFECAPGLFANLAFDWAWFRENLEDETAHLGYLSGDDFRMIAPMFAWVDSSNKPFLLTMITSVAHDPYELPPWAEVEPAEFREGRYEQAVRFTDRFVERVCRELKQRKLLDSTLLCVIGDHGDSFRPESNRGRWVPYEEVIRVPWVIRWPGRIAARQIIKWPCSQLDVTPTILGLLGVGIDAHTFDGRNAMQLQYTDRRLFFSSWFRNSPLGFIEGDAKYIFWPYTKTVFVYNLLEDPAEASPQSVTGPLKQQVIDRVQSWQRDNQLVITAKRFREHRLYEHWHTFSSGRTAWAYYAP